MTHTKNRFRVVVRAAPVLWEGPAALPKPGSHVARGGEGDIGQLHRLPLRVVQPQAHDVGRPRQHPLQQHDAHNSSEALQQLQDQQCRQSQLQSAGTHGAEALEYILAF